MNVSNGRETSISVTVLDALSIIVMSGRVFLCVNVSCSELNMSGERTVSFKIYLVLFAELIFVCKISTTLL